MTEQQIEYAKTIAKAASGICPICDLPSKQHIYPEKVACPKCGQIDKVHSWTAWGHPNGQLECNRCNSHRGHRGEKPETYYQTFYKGEDGQTVIVPWHADTDEDDEDDDEDSM